MSFLGKTIRLKGKSMKGKNRVREHSDEWFVQAETDKVLFAKDKPGPWLYIVPLGKDHDHKSGRWIHGDKDLDFDLFIQG